MQEGVRRGLPRSSPRRLRDRRGEQQRAAIPPIRFPRLLGVHRWTRIEVRGSGDSADLGGGETPFHEPAPLYGSDGRDDSVAVYAVHRGQCGGGYGGEGQDGPIYNLPADWERDGGVFGQPDEFLGDQAHQRADAPGFGERQVGRCGGGVCFDIQEPRYGNGDDGIRRHRHGRGALQRSQETVQGYLIDKIKNNKKIENQRFSF